VPDDEDSLRLEDVLSSDEVLGEVFSVVADFSPHVVDHEGLGEVVLVVGEGHGLEVEGHSSSAFEISELVHAGGGVHVGVEELGHVSSVLGEVGVVEALVPGLVEVDNVVRAGVEEGSELLVSKDLVEDVNFIDSRLSSLVSNSSSEGERSGSEVDFPDKSLRSHHEGEGGVTEEASSPSVVGSAEVLADLVEVIRSPHSPFEVIVSEDVVGVLELGGVVVGLSRLSSIAINVGVLVHVNTIGSLGRRLSHVVVVGIGIASEVTLGASHKVVPLLIHMTGTSSAGYYKVKGDLEGGVLLTRVLAIVYIFD